MFYFQLLGLLMALSFGLTPLAAVSQENHPLVLRYENSVIIDKTISEFGTYKLITGRTSIGEFEKEILEGKVTRIVYKNPPHRSTLEIFSNYQEGLSAAGATAIYTCALDECGRAAARSAWKRFNGLFAATDGDPRYFSGKLMINHIIAYVALMVGRNRSQLDVVEVVDAQEDFVVIDAAALAQGIDRDGKVSVPGIYFDVDRAAINPKSKPALNEMAKLLRQHPALKLFVVGHTEMTGDLPSNQRLSEAYAKSVVKTLVENYGVAATRLEGYGVGPLAPITSNESKMGRIQNRRVELVAR